MVHGTRIIQRSPVNQDLLTLGDFLEVTPAGVYRWRLHVKKFYSAAFFTYLRGKSIKRCQNAVKYA